MDLKNCCESSLYKHTIFVSTGLIYASGHTGAIFTAAAIKLTVALLKRSILGR